MEYALNNPPPPPPPPPPRPLLSHGDMWYVHHKIGIGGDANCMGNLSHIADTVLVWDTNLPDQSPKFIFFYQLTWNS